MKGLNPCTLLGLKQAPSVIEITIAKDNSAGKKPITIVEQWEKGNPSLFVVVLQVLLHVHLTISHK